MACLHMKKKLSEYLDGALDAEDKTFVEQHLATCEDCASTFAELKSTLEHMRTLDEVEPPAWFAERVMQRVHKEAVRKSILSKLFFPLHIKIPAEALALVMVAVVAFYVFDAMNPEVAMKERVAPAPPITAGEPEADISPQELFNHPEDETVRPFAPSGTASAPEEEADWEREEIGGGVVTDAKELAAKEKAQLRNEAEPVGETLMKSEASSDDYRAGKPEVLLRDAEAPVVAAEPTMDTLGSERFTYAKASLPEPGLRMEVAVEDVDFARHEIEEAIKRLGGNIIDEEGQPDNIVMAEIGSEKVDKLVNSIAETGMIKSRALIGEGETVSVRIELSE